MGVKVRGATSDGVLEFHVALESLMQVARLSDVDRSPTPVGALTGIDEITGQGTERSLEWEDLVLIFLSGLAGPDNARP
jgi:hypothetical protein